MSTSTPPFPHPTSSPLERPAHRTRPVWRGLATAALTLGLLGLGAASASAHVTVHPDETAPGSFAQLTFRVPTESPDASTTSLTVTLPQDHPFTSVSVRPVPGWTAKLQEDALPEPVDVGGATITKAVHTVTWTADPGHAIKPGQYQEFPLSVGRLPDGGTVSIPAVQKYSDGTVVRWNQTTTQGQAEPEHPAPSFTVEAASAQQQADPTTGEDTGSSDGLARGLGGAALVVALGGLGVALTGRRGRTGAAAPATPTSQRPTAQGPSHDEGSK